tara:strand:+ start:5949 stop:6344 length:396 start_codon:yes stop_codon:yes gene_type:complete
MKHYDKYQLAELINESFPSLQVNASTLQITPFQASVNDSLTLGVTNPLDIKALYIGSLEWNPDPLSEFQIAIITREPSRTGNFFMRKDYQSNPVRDETFVSYRNLLMSYFEVTNNAPHPSGIVFHGCKINW